jgi:hypothetical protein
MYADTASFVKNILVEGSGKTKKIVIIGNASHSVKILKESLIGAADVRKTKRYNADRTLGVVMKYLVRELTDVKGPRKIELVAATDRDGMYRNAAGHFVKLPNATAVMRTDRFLELNKVV